MFIHLVSLTKGAMRMVVVSQLDQAGQMRGLITTLQQAAGAVLLPVSAPIVLARRQSFEADAFGDITRDSRHWAAYQQIVAETVEQGYVRLLSP